ncbi:50S ribosomal protein L10 [Candidatus Nomurabacteria bacterium RIFCSPLOWO2_01_FULL_36_10b]|uniref:Large ribosomal subunit protein uL10 n=1 Tax=Candidatus Nomurabacteria bacterium RIFCSPLOWO2_01_FULL_36_10b TaxID=1801766 RepID=A0A1F6WQB0_9BACT|nr:MAG: 50S ribosomal protein L10 [Candidatus Nomurabacteria bacterium RIFCSPLOWO2_01_FULL_36_10b]
MTITRGKKKEIVDELQKSLKGAKAMTFVQFKGLSVVDSTNMRQNLRSESVGYKVAKKTLLTRTLDTLGIKGAMPSLEGNIAITWSHDDETAPARLVYAFRKGHEDNIALVGGVFQGSYIDAIAMNDIAMIPSMQVLRGMFVNVINSPIQGFVVALNKIAEQKS